MLHQLRLVALLSLAAIAQAQTSRVSVDAQGNEGNGNSGRAALSSDGRYLVFTSSATNLVAGDTNGEPDIFVKDLQSGAIARVSVSSSGVESNSHSLYPVIDHSGRFVAFYSHGDNLVPGDNNGSGDIFVRDQSLGLTERVSVASDGTEGNSSSRGVSISGDGRFVAFTSNATNLVFGDNNSFVDIFVRDRLLATTQLVSVDSAGLQGDGLCSAPSISGDGKIVAFASRSTNLVPGDTNGLGDVFVRDLARGLTERVSVSSGGAEGDGHSGYVHTTGYHYTAVSTDGRFVVFPSYATNLVPGDTNGVADAFLHDRRLGTTLRASVDSAGGESSDHSTYPVVWGGGRYVAFSSAAPELAAHDVNGVADVFVHDFVRAETTLWSTDSFGGRGDLASSYPAISTDGKLLAWESYATNLVPADTNDTLDTFVHGFESTPAPTVYCVAQQNSLGCRPTIAALGNASLSSKSSFTIRANGVLNAKAGLLLYGFSAANAPWNGGTLCVGLPVKRAGATNSGGTPTPGRDCSGLLSFDFSLLVQAGSGPDLVLGANVCAQYWSRDPGVPGRANLTDALRFEIGP